jgi:hypothetical protein
MQAFRSPSAERIACAGIALLVAVLIAAPATGDERASESAEQATKNDAERRREDDDERPPEDEPLHEHDGLTSEIWHQPPPRFEPYWELLRLPELALRLVATPALPLVVAAENHRLDRRVYDLLTNDEETSLFLPVVVVRSRDGVGLGLSYVHRDLFGGSERFEAKGVVKANLDREVAFGYSTPLAPLDARELGAGVEYELDHNDRFYGIGNETSPDDVRLLEHETSVAYLDVDLGGPTTHLAPFTSDLYAGYRHERLSSGIGEALSAVAEGDSVAPPPGFGQSVDYAELAWTFRHDTRDSSGRTQRGTRAELELYGTTDLRSADLNAVRATLRAAWFIPVAPLHRVLALSAGAAAAAPLAEASEVPLQSLVTLGQKEYLRGYAKDRFRDRAGFWASAEYRYPIFEFSDTGAGLSSTLFVDVGRVGEDVSELVEAPVRAAFGFGVRAETSRAFVFRAQVAFSEEGAEVLFALNDTP